MGEAIKDVEKVKGGMGENIKVAAKTSEYILITRTLIKAHAMFDMPREQEAVNFHSWVLDLVSCVFYFITEGLTFSILIFCTLCPPIYKVKLYQSNSWRKRSNVNTLCLKLCWSFETKYI